MITIVLISLDYPMGHITLKLIMQYTLSQIMRFCLQHIFILSRTTLVLYKDKFCLVPFHCQLFWLTKFSKLSLLYIVYLNIIL